MNVKEVYFTIDSEPQGKGRPRFSRYRKTAYTPKKTVAFENKVIAAYREYWNDWSFGKDVPLKAVIYAGFAIPKSVSKAKRSDMLNGFLFPLKKPDADNIAKAVLDALNGEAYYDDAQIVELIVKKGYREKPIITVTILPLFAEGV